MTEAKESNVVKEPLKRPDFCNGWVKAEHAIRYDAEQLMNRYMGIPTAGDFVQTGLKLVDSELGGLEPGELVLLAGPVGYPMSLVAASIAWHVAVEKKGRVGYFALKERPELLMRKMMCAHSGDKLFTITSVLKHGFEDDQWNTYSRQCHRFDTPELYFRSPSLTKTSLEEFLGFMDSFENPEDKQTLIVIDGLDVLLEGLGDKADKARVIQAIKETALTKNLPILVTKTVLTEDSIHQIKNLAAESLHLVELADKVFMMSESCRHANSSSINYFSLKIEKSPQVKSQYGFLAINTATGEIRDENY